MRVLQIRLTDEQAELYDQSSSFRNGADQFLYVMIPVFLEGLAARARREDREAALRYEAALRAKPFQGGIDGIQ